MKKQSIHTVALILAIALMTVSSCFKKDTGILITSYVRDQEMSLNPQRTYTTTSVDLGLSVQWAACNLGASSPEESGGYYQWAGTKDVASMSIDLGADNCPYHRESRYEYDTGWTKYIPADRSTYWSGSGSPDDKTVLDPEDDVAHVKLGWKWRMPTAEEWRELRENCTWTWTTQKGVIGYRVTGKLPGYTDKSIFLPAAGVRYEGRFLNFAGEGGFYWSSSLDTGFPNWASCFHFERENIQYETSDFRWSGLSVRPVYVEKVPDHTEPSPNNDSLPGEFSVSATKKVRFSRGNLVATINASGTPTAWKFAANQYDYIGSATANTSIGSTAGDIDLFGWSTAATKYGISTSTSNSGYSGDFVDWGKNIGDGSTWRTLSKDEWVYLFETRTNASSLYKYGVTVCGKTNCLIIAPDNWDTSANPLQTSYDATAWATAETAGLVCLPAAGSRNGSLWSSGSVGHSGYYWSSTAYGSLYAYNVYISSFDVYTGDHPYRYYGSSVRLITESAGGYTPAVKVTGVSLNKSKTTIDVGDTETLVATVTPANAANKQLSWTSSDPAIATVDANGKVTGEAVGSAAITATTADGNFTAVCLVTVAPGTPAGALPGEFSVSATKKVRFSRGNLVATVNASGAPTAWKFAANQYDYIGSATANTSIGSTAGDIDLFGWSTASTTYGISTSTSLSDYSGDFVDWGKNIGDGSTWRTLSKDEWVYLFETRTNASSLYKYGVTVCGKTNCLIIAPDNWDTSANPLQTSYGATAWATAEAAGLVCLPAAGGRAGSRVSRVGDYGDCWSSTADDEGRACRVYFGSFGVYPGNIGSRPLGCSVRLITECQ